jgi:hypothetical protein
MSVRPFDVPIAIEAATAITVGQPKFRLPVSEKTWPVIFLSLVHRTTSHGGCGVSDPSWLGTSVLAMLACLECGVRKAGEMPLGVPKGEGGNRAENLRSKGWRAPGRCDRGTDTWECALLLGGEDRIEPCKAMSSELS